MASYIATFPDNLQNHKLFRVITYNEIKYLQWLISLTHTGVAPAISNVLAWPPEEIDQQSGCSFSLFSCRRRPKCVNNCDPRDGRPANQVTDRC